MQLLKKLSLFFVCAVVIGLAGCVSDQQYKQLKVQNDTQRKRIAELQSQVQATNLQLDQLKRKLQTAQGKGNVELEALQQKVAALEEDLAKKKALIGLMEQQLLHGGAHLPAELNTMLEDFAKSQDMVEYDAGKGIVKFKSDLLFDRGSDQVAPDARQAVSALSNILNTDSAKNFDIIIAGHTDDMPIGKPQTRQKHPTNWHLSAHRAIAVLDVMTSSGITEQRMSVRGFGEFRPLTPNKPNKGGSPQNRRVEIYIVPKGM
ncbi:MAG: OmpA family protein [Sedimentisphaerales bacterium]|nr:OmpA family protein [Sedimentisphaerales bacterium]